MHAKTGERFKAEGGTVELMVLDLLGEGRTAEVYLVRETGKDSEDCVLKVAQELPQASLGERNARLSRTQSALALLGEHPGIVRGGPGGWHQGRAFFSMELLQGPSRMCWSRPPPTSILRALMCMRSASSCSCC